MSSGNEEVKKFIRSEIKKALDKEFAKLRLELANLKKEIADVKTEITSAELRSNKKIQTVAESVKTAATGGGGTSGSSSGGAGGGSSTTSENLNDKQLVVIAEHVNKQVAKILDEDIRPQMAIMQKVFSEKTLDGTQMITDYRKRVMGQDSVKQITTGDSKKDFQAGMFAFTDFD